MCHTVVPVDCARMTTPDREPSSSPSDRPIPESDVTAYPLDDELVLYDARTTVAHVLNPSAAKIWELCDGSRTLPELAQALSLTYGLDPQRAETDVSELVGTMRASGLLAGPRSSRGTLHTVAPYSG